MDIHLNDLVIEEGFSHVYLQDISFRNIDQEFLIFETVDTYDSILKNNLYYCFIKPYEGLHFRLIGQTDAETQDIIVDEDIPESAARDFSYSDLAQLPFSKVIENGDLISNQQIVNIGIDLYEDETLMKTREVEWIDCRRIVGNPDIIELDIDGEVRQLKLKEIQNNALLAFDDECQYVIDQQLNAKKL